MRLQLGTVPIGATIATGVTGATAAAPSELPKVSLQVVADDQAPGPGAVVGDRPAPVTLVNPCPPKNASQECGQGSG